MHETHKKKLKNIYKSAREKIRLRSLRERYIYMYTYIYIYIYIRDILSMTLAALVFLS